jgi:hypothetical protein
MERNSGLATVVVGLGAISFAQVVGFTKDSGGVDWISIITAAAGVVVALMGVFMMFRGSSRGSTSGSHA